MKFKNVNKHIRVWKGVYTYIDICKGSILYKTPKYSIVGIFYCNFFDIIIISKNHDNFYLIEGISILYEKDEMKEYFKKYVKFKYFFGGYVGIIDE